MTDDPDSIVLRYLRRLDAKADRIGEAVSDLSAEVRGIKGHLAAFMQDEIAQDSALASIKDRLTRMERRLDITETDE
jgi:hypothetical protein